MVLEMKGIEIISTAEELIELGLDLADGSVSYEDLLNWIIDYS